LHAQAFQASALERKPSAGERDAGPRTHREGSGSKEGQFDQRADDHKGNKFIRSERALRDTSPYHSVNRPMNIAAKDQIKAIEKSWQNPALREFAQSAMS